MHDVRHHIGAEVAADRAFGGLAGISRSEQITHPLDDIVALQRHHNHGAGLHEVLDLGVERFVGDMRVVLAEHRGGKTGHFAPDDVEARGLKAREHRAHETLLHAVRLKDNEGFLHKNGRT